MNGEFIKETIATGFKNQPALPPGMSPGFPYAIWPNGKQDGEMAHIFVAGDGDFKFHVLYPSYDNDEDFSFTD